VHEAIKKGLLEAYKAKITKKIVQVTRGWVIHADALKKYQVSESHITRGHRYTAGSRFTTIAPLAPHRFSRANDLSRQKKLGLRNPQPSIER